MSEPVPNDRQPTQERRRPFETYLTTVEIADLITPRNKHLRFRLPAGKTMIFKAGQFVQMFIPDGEKIRRTSYSVASPPVHQDFFELCVTLVDGGKSSTFLHGLKVGDTIQAMGPLGKFTNPADRESVFVCTGSGIAPFRSMIFDLAAKKETGNMYLVFGNRYEPDIIYRKEWEKLGAEDPRFNYRLTLSRDTAWKGAHGYVQDNIDGFVPNLKDKNYFICGLANMIDAVSQKLLSLGVPQQQILFEKYD